MVGFPLDDGTDGNQCVELLRLGHFLQRNGNFQCAGYGRDKNILIGDAEPFQFAQKGIEQPAADFLVEAGLYDADAEILSLKIHFECIDTHNPSPR